MKLKMWAVVAKGIWRGKQEKDWIPCQPLLSKQLNTLQDHEVYGRTIFENKKWAREWIKDTFGKDGACIKAVPCKVYIKDEDL